jgi:ornithine cyclodeaminase/alanine dehydrogenase-like protein (mu-crystallin family)
LESGDLLNPISKGMLNWNNVFNLSELFEYNLNKNKNKIFFKSLGIALWDIAIAKGIYDLTN